MLSSSSEFPDSLLMNIRTRKIANDLWLNKTRTLLVVLTIAIGVLAVGTISRSWVILSRELTATYLAANPASAILVTDKPFDDDVVQAVQKMKEVREAAKPQIARVAHSTVA